MNKHCLHEGYPLLCRNSCPACSMGPKPKETSAALSQPSCHSHEPGPTVPTLPKNTPLLAHSEHLPRPMCLTALAQLHKGCSWMHPGLSSQAVKGGSQAHAGGPHASMCSQCSLDLVTGAGKVEGWARHVMLGGHCFTAGRTRLSE